MAASLIKVCQNTACKSDGAVNVLHDIEELVGDACDVEPCGCLGKCGLGPNIEVEDQDGVPRIYTTLRSWKRIKEAVEEIANVPTREIASKVGLLKYSARRAQKPAERHGKIAAAFKAIGGEKAGSAQEPLLAATIFALRSQYQEEASMALQDARTAVKLLPDWPRAQLVLASAGERAQEVTVALHAYKLALQLGVGDRPAMDAVKKQIARLEGMKKELKDGGSLTARRTLRITPMKPTDIFTYMGGRERLSTLAYGVHEHMFEHPLTKHFFPPTMNPKRVTERNVDYLCGIFGGPKYVGPNMMDAHEFLKVTDKQYDVMVEGYKNVLTEMAVSPACYESILEQVEGMRYSIVFRADRPNPSARNDPRVMKLHKERLALERKISGSTIESASSAGIVRPAGGSAAVKKRLGRCAAGPGKKKSMTPAPAPETKHKVGLATVAVTAAAAEDRTPQKQDAPLQGGYPMSPQDVGPGLIYDSAPPALNSATCPTLFLKEWREASRGAAAAAVA